MNIVISGIQDLENDINGVATYSKELTDELNRAGHQASICTIYNDASLSARFFNLLRRFMIWVNQIYPHSTFRLTRILLVCVQHFHQLFKLRRKCDIVSAQDVFSAGVALLAVGRKKPIVLTSHFWALPWEEFVSAGITRRNSASFKLLKWIMCRTLNSDRLRIIAMSQVTRRMIEQEFPNASDRISVIYYGIRPRELMDVSHMLPKDRQLIINVGRLEKRKNQRFLVEVAAQFKQRDERPAFVLVGDHEEQEVRHLQAQLRTHGLEEDVYILGPQDHETVFSMMHQADLYFHASTAESFGLVLIEAVSAGTPVVSLDYEALHEIYPGVENVLLPNNISPETAAEHLSFLLSNNNERKKLFEDELVCFQERFSVTTSIRNYTKYYKEAIQQFDSPIPSQSFSMRYDNR